MDAVTKAHDGQVQMIGSSVVLVHQHALWIQKKVGIVVSDAGAEVPRPRSTRVDGQGRTARIQITPGQAHDLAGAELLLAILKSPTIVIAKDYDADRVRTRIRASGAIANIPNMSRRKRDSTGKRHCAASVALSNASSTSLSSSAASPPATTSSTTAFWPSKSPQARSTQAIARSGGRTGRGQPQWAFREAPAAAGLEASHSFVRSAAST